MLEGTDARVHHIDYTSGIEEARNRGQLRTNSFIRLRRYVVGGTPSIEARDLGNAESILRNKRYLREAARQRLQRGIVPEEDGWGGWLGRYQAAVRRTALGMEQFAKRENERARDHGNSRGR